MQLLSSLWMVNLGRRWTRRFGKRPCKSWNVVGSLRPNLSEFVAKRFGLVQKTKVRMIDDIWSGRVSF